MIMQQLENVMDRIAKNVGCDISTLRERIGQVLDSNSNAWEGAGKSKDDQRILAARVAGRQLKTEADKIKRSGCITYEGAFISVPSYKDWAKMSYDKNTKLLASLELEPILNLVRNGTLVYFEDNVDGTYTMHYNPSLWSRSEFEEGIDSKDCTELPKEAVLVGSNAYYLIWDKKNRTFPSGSKNFKYGRARPSSERERQCLFFGRKQDSGDGLALHTFCFNHKLAGIQFPTFTAGSIAMRPANSGDRAYGKPELSTFVGDEALASIFPSAPFDENGGFVKDMVKSVLDSFDDFENYYETHRNDDDWYDQLIAVVGEVVHVDPRNDGGYIITVGDLNIESIAPTVDVFVDNDNADIVNFSVGTTMALVGSVWKSREEEMRMSVSGFYPLDIIAPTVDDEKWDGGDWGEN